MLPWSSGQDAALSRLNQGFDSPWKYQKKTVPMRYCFFHLIIPGKGSRTRKGASVKSENPANFRTASGPSCLHKAAQDGGLCTAKDANSPWKYQKKKALKLLKIQRFQGLFLFCIFYIFLHFLNHFRVFYTV